VFNCEESTKHVSKVSLPSINHINFPKSTDTSNTECFEVLQEKHKRPGWHWQQIMESIDPFMYGSFGSM
jgi:hypothetical protein